MRAGALRGMAALLAAVLAAGGGCPALAEGGAIPDLHAEPVTAEDGAFVFRENIRWGNTPSEVREKENPEMVERKQGDWSILYTQQKAQVSLYMADLVYMFRAEQLRMITYDFGTSAGSGAFSYLEGALSSVYGGMAEAASAEVVRAMDQIYPGYYTENLLNRVRSWTAADGTVIYLYYYGPEAFAILYVSPAAVLPGAGQYNTTGL